MPDHEDHTPKLGDIEDMETIMIPASYAAGILVPELLKFLGMYIGKQGVSYYAEVHRMRLNSYCHTLGMPIFAYGMLVVLPLLMGEKEKDALCVQDLLYGSYMTHYIHVSPRVGIVTSVVYAVPLVMARKRVIDFYSRFMSKDKTTLVERVKTPTFQEAAAISICTMVCQEFLGHYMSGDPPSRVEGIPNAILYAMYYSISHFV